MLQQMYHHSKPVAHRSHKKTSTGCKACKLRKVKCDEERPVCRKCQVHFSNIEKCDYEPVIRRYRPDQEKDATQNLTSSNLSTQEAIYSAPSISDLSNILAKQSMNAESSAHIRTQQTLAIRQAANNGQRQLDWRGFQLCKCPCHASQEYADMLSDALFGICRICGNFPNWTTSLEQCCPVVSPKRLQESRIDPFGVLPVKSSPSVDSLMHHWVNSLALFPTKIQSNYCTNPTWLTAAISNAALFNVTLYASSLHLAGLHGKKESPESLYYKAQTIKCLNECLTDESEALRDETIAAVLCLLFIVCVTGDEEEVEAHIRGLRQMVKLRGGIHAFTLDGVFLHMICTTNHVTAVLSETPAIHPITGPPANQRRCLPIPPSPSLCTSPNLKFRSSEVWRDFGLTIGLHPIIADVLHELGYVYSVCDAFTLRLLPMHREEFGQICERLERVSVSEDEEMVRM